MSNGLKNFLAVIAGLVIGSVANMSLIMAGSALVPAPDGVDVTTMEGLKAGMALMGPMNFLFPFLAHAVGTLVGGIIASLLAGSQRTRLPMIIAAFFLLGGIANAMMLPAPAWFIAADVLLAYLPMGWLAIKLGEKLKPSAA